jgi:nucleotide-binding universal stress UspA family protein
MLKILCPTDFSSNADFAIEYAVNISNDLHAQLFFVTSFKVPRFAGGLHSIGEKINDALNDDLKAFGDKIKHLIRTNIKPEFAVIEGNTTDSILLYANQKGIDLIIMGTKGSSSIANMVIGSITKKVFEKSHIPVLAIPYSFKYQLTGNKILLSLDTKGISNIHSIGLLKSLKNIPGTLIDVFHLTAPEEQVEFSDNTKFLSGLINKIVVKEGDDPVKEIKHYVDENDIGILVMIRRQHSFWEKLFVETTTTESLFSTNVPILLLPD